MKDLSQNDSTNTVNDRELNPREITLKINRPYEIRVVLVRSIYERNIGAASRAMSNMGCEHLILIEPKCEITIEAQKAAATGQQGLSNRTVYSSWDQFFQNEPESIRIAFTARDGRGRVVKDFASTLAELNATSMIVKKKSPEPFIVHLIFGPEDWGLSASDLELVNFCACIPTYGENSSLNLAQAVLLGLFIIREEWGGTRTRLDGQVSHRRNFDKGEVFPDESLKTWLTEMGFNITNRRINAHTVLRRMLLQNAPTKKEFFILETVLQQGIRKLREYNKLYKEKYGKNIEEVTDVKSGKGSKGED